MGRAMAAWCTVINQVPKCACTYASKGGSTWAGPRFIRSTKRAVQNIRATYLFFRTLSRAMSGARAAPPDKATAISSRLMSSATRCKSQVRCFTVHRPFDALKRSVNVELGTSLDPKYNLAVWGCSLHLHVTFFDAPSSNPNP